MAVWLVEHCGEIARSFWQQIRTHEVTRKDSRAVLGHGQTGPRVVVAEANRPPNNEMQLLCRHAVDDALEAVGLEGMAPRGQRGPTKSEARGSRAKFEQRLLG